MFIRFDYKINILNFNKYLIFKSIIIFNNKLSNLKIFIKKHNLLQDYFYFFFNCKLIVHFQSKFKIFLGINKLKSLSIPVF
jgi:hypothetical protein